MKRFTSTWIIGMLVLMMVSLTMIGATQLNGAEKEAKKRGYLGVTTEELSRLQKRELKADFGVVITEIEPDSPADRDGLMEDDVIQWVNDVKITRPSTLARVIRAIKPGEKAKISIIRDGKQKTISVTIGKASSERGYRFSIPHPQTLFSWYRSNGAFLGVQLHELNEELAQYFGVKAGDGVLILQVVKNSPAEKAGLKSGDVIVKIDDEAVSKPKEVHEIISEFDEEDEVTIEFVRQNKRQTVTVTLEARNDDEAIINFPQRMIREFRWNGRPEESIDLWLPEIAPGQKDREIIIKKKQRIDLGEKI